MMLGTPGLIYFLVENFTVGLIYGCLFSVSHVNQMVKFDPEGKTLRDRQVRTKWKSLEGRGAKQRPHITYH